MKTAIHLKKYLINVFIMVVLFMFLGCMANFCRYKVSSDIQKTFETFQVLADHVYYFTGSTTRPDAVMGLHKSYILTSADLWSEVKDINKELKFWVQQMSNNPSWPTYGYTILDPNGKQIGIYYSAFDTAPVKMEGENKVSVYLPDKDSTKTGPRLRRF